MTQIDPDGGGERPKLAAPLKLAVVTVAVLGVVALLYGIGSALFHPGPKLQRASGSAGSSISTVDPAAAQQTAALHVLPPPSPQGSGAAPPDQSFAGPDGKPVKVADFKGKVVVLNFWATWCPPCRKEMPSLAALAAAEAGKPVQVIPLSIDNAAATDKAKAFIAANAPLGFYQDAGMTLPFKVDPVVDSFPTTLVFDKTGRLRTEVKSDVEWDSDHVRKIIDKLAAE